MNISIFRTTLNFERAFIDLKKTEKKHPYVAWVEEENFFYSLASFLRGP